MFENGISFLQVFKDEHIRDRRKVAEAHNFHSK